ncbi:hypothetical protein JL722_5271 [Aureococcus anophagefferens]|nr:hypothetical protein JL722_5271 [Aureococcus anophagefferens]
MVYLAEMYEKGLGVKLDKKKAERLYWFERAAAKGHEKAIENLDLAALDGAIAKSSRRVVAEPEHAACAGESLGLGVVVAAFLSAPTFAVSCLAFLNAKPAWRKDDAAAGGMENDTTL